MQVQEQGLSEKASCPQAAKNYRWLVVKEELEDNQGAAAAALGVTLRRVKTILKVSEFVRNLGKRNKSTDQGRRHA